LQTSSPAIPPAVGAKNAAPSFAADNQQPAFVLAESSQEVSQPSRDADFSAAKNLLGEKNLPPVEISPTIAAASGTFPTWTSETGLPGTPSSQESQSGQYYRHSVIIEKFLQISRAFQEAIVGEESGSREAAKKNSLIPVSSASISSSAVDNSASPRAETVAEKMTTPATIGTHIFNLLEVICR